MVYFYADLLSILAVCLVCAWCTAACSGADASAGVGADCAYGSTAVCCLDVCMTAAEQPAARRLGAGLLALGRVSE